MDVPSRLLQLEVTEGIIMANPARALEVSSRLKALGITLHVDDFDTGYSSLSYLTRLPIDHIKIDKSFVIDMATEENDDGIVHSTIDLGHNLGMRVAAEGVDNAATRSLLASWGCDLARGYHVAGRCPPRSSTTGSARAITSQ